MVNARLLARYGARFVAQTLAGLGTGALLDLATWRALVMGLVANIIPAVVTFLESYALTGIIPEPPENP